LHRVTGAQSSNTDLALNNVPETVKLLVDQRLLDGNFANLLQIFWEILIWCNEALFLTGYPEENLGLK
jgi:hypothetical protein